MPKIYHAPNHDVTDDDRTKAFDRTTKSLLALDKIRRGLELPPESLATVWMAYGDALREVQGERISAELAAEHDADRDHARSLCLDPDADGGMLGAWMTGTIPSPPPGTAGAFGSPRIRARTVASSLRGMQDHTGGARVSLPLLAYDKNGGRRTTNPGDLLVIVVPQPFAAYRADGLSMRDAHLWTVESFSVGNREQLDGHLPGTSFVDGAHIFKKQIETAQTAMDIVVRVRRGGDAPGVFYGKLHGEAAV